jgi:MazG family protein
MREELGDVLLQVLFHSVMAEERGAFNFHDVAHGLITKMRGRHPHLYGDGVKEPWEKMKSKQRESLADGLPLGLPALHRAHRLQDRAAAIGFDWPDWHGPADKVVEELEEVRHTLKVHPPATAPSGAPILDERHAKAEDELGDLLFSVVNLCRKINVNASLALDKANAKFQRRFEAVERLAKQRGVILGKVDIDALEALWVEVKESGEVP